MKISEVLVIMDFVGLSHIEKKVGSGSDYPSENPTPDPAKYRTRTWALKNKILVLEIGPEWDLQLWFRVNIYWPCSDWYIWRQAQYLACPRWARRRRRSCPLPTPRPSWPGGAVVAHSVVQVRVKQLFFFIIKDSTYSFSFKLFK